MSVFTELRFSFSRGQIMANMSNFPAELVNCIQSDFLKNEFIYGIQSEMAWANLAGKQPFPAGIGETIKFTRAGLRTPVTTPKTAASYNSDLDNGKTTSTSPVEQFVLPLYMYGDMERVNVLQKNVGIRDTALKAAKTIGLQGAQSRDRVAKNTVVHVHQGGNTRVVASGTLSTTTAHVDDITGFTEVLTSAGAPIAVSGSNTLTVKHYDSTGAFVQNLTVTAAVADDPNVSTTYYGAEKVGISGQLTYSTATLPVIGDSFVAVTAYPVYRPNGKLNTSLLTGGDVATLSIFMDAVARLRMNNVPDFGGFYHVMMDPLTERQLLADPDFKLLLAGNPNAAEMKRMGVYQMAGCIFQRSTEAAFQATGYSALSVNVSRAIVMGQDAFIEADWEGIDQFIQEDWQSSLHYTVVEGPLVMTIRAPIDTSGQQVTFSWDLYTGFCVGTDKFARPEVISTADASVLHKRAIVIEHAS